MESGPFIDLFGLWEKAFSIRVVENEHLIKPSFHLFLSAFCKPRYIYGGSYRHSKTDLFICQQSGTGKSEVLKLVALAASHLKENAYYINTFTEPGIIGTVREKKDGKDFIPVVRYGKIQSHAVVLFDEAKTILLPNKWSHDLLSALNGFLDERRLVKPMAAGDLEYDGKAVLGTGTFEFSGMDSAILDTGFFPRWNLRYHKYDSHDINHITRMLANIGTKDYKKDLMPLLGQIDSIMRDVNQAKYRRGKDFIIKPTEESIKLLNEKIVAHHSDKIIGKFGNDGTQRTIDTFLARSLQLGMRFATHHSVINGHKTISTESAEYAFDEVAKHLESAAQLTSDFLELGKYSMKDQKSKIFDKIGATNMIKQYLIMFPGSNRLKLREYHNANRGKFRIGENAVITLLEDLIGRGEVIEKIKPWEKGKGGYNETSLYVKQ